MIKSNAPENVIWRAVLEAMHPAEELGGPEFPQYIQLMGWIEREARHRIEVAQAAMKQTPSFPVGTRVRARTDVDRYPEFCIPANCLGDVIFDSQNNCMAVHVPGLDDDGLRSWECNVLYVDDFDNMHAEWEAIEVPGTQDNRTMRELAAHGAVSARRSGFVPID